MDRQRDPRIAGEEVPAIVVERGAQPLPPEVAHVFVVTFDGADPPRRIVGEHRHARFLADGREVAVWGNDDSGAFIASIAPGGDRVAAVPEEDWRVDAVFADPSRVFLGDGTLWGIGSDGRRWLAKPPGAPIDRLQFSADGARALFTNEDKEVTRIALLARSGEWTELREAPALPPGRAVTALAWSPDAARLAAVHASDDGACLVHWALDGPAEERRTCFLAADVPGGADALASPRHGLAWSPDGQRLAAALGDGTALLDARGEAPPVWLVSPAHRGERTRLTFGLRGERLVESTEHGVYLWRPDASADAPLTLLEFDANAKPYRLLAMPVDEDRAIVTIVFGYTKDGIRTSVRRWTIDPDEAIAALRDESPQCLESAWRQANLHETEAEARERYCRCRASFSTPDPACAR